MWQPMFKHRNITVAIVRNEIIANSGVDLETQLVTDSHGAIKTATTLHSTHHKKQTVATFAAYIPLMIVFTSTFVGSTP